MTGFWANCRIARKVIGKQAFCNASVRPGMFTISGDRSMSAESIGEGIKGTRNNKLMGLLIKTGMLSGNRTGPPLARQLLFILSDTMDFPLSRDIFPEYAYRHEAGRAYSETQISDLLRSAGCHGVERLDFTGPNDSGLLPVPSDTFGSGFDPLNDLPLTVQHEDEKPVLPGIPAE